jgi:hypothetical protein
LNRQISPQDYRLKRNDFGAIQQEDGGFQRNQKTAVDLVMRIAMIITAGRETGRYLKSPWFGLSDISSSG